MENSIIRDCLKIIINCSAFLSSLKKKNKTMYFLTEVIYIFIISILPVFMISILLGIINVDKQANTAEIFNHLMLIIGASMLSFMIFNFKNEKKIENYIKIVNYHIGKLRTLCYIVRVMKNKSFFLGGTYHEEKSNRWFTWNSNGSISACRMRIIREKGQQECITDDFSCFKRRWIRYKRCFY